MPSSHKQAVTAQDLTNDLNDDLVREYLKDNDDFLQRSS